LREHRGEESERKNKTTSFVIRERERERERAEMKGKMVERERRYI
jgi:hypothetical protein